MNTPAHAVLNLAALERFVGSGTAARGCGGWIAVGAVVPDLPNMVLFAVYRLVLGVPTEVVYAQVYPSTPWHWVLAPSHSAVVVSVLLGLALWRKHAGFVALLLSMLAHIGCDLVTHGGDAHPHLWPLTDARFDSPLSYWDRGRYAGVFVPVELGVALVASWVAWRRGRQPWRRGLLIVSCLWLGVAYATGLAFWGT